ncbi:hypothetical protein BKA63DRAFT_97989 [Paraphoma chrysanthemicola]|nr:hypothetical protein BKA63DRAFT_97989 [Paraphoma chrysanthemicola]
MRPSPRASCRSIHFARRQQRLSWAPSRASGSQPTCPPPTHQHERLVFQLAAPFAVELRSIIDYLSFAASTVLSLTAAERILLAQAHATLLATLRPMLLDFGVPGDHPTAERQRKTSMAARPRAQCLASPRPPGARFRSRISRLCQRHSGFSPWCPHTIPGNI